MKVLEFETSKGKFLLVDENEQGKIINPDCEYLEIGRLRNIIEEQARQVVDSKINSAYVLFGLLALEDIFLWENPYSDKLGITDFDYHRNKAEQKTFYNPYIFKI